MTSTILDEFLARVEERLTHLDPTEREGMIDEMRAHLEAAIADRMAADPALTRPEATLQEIREFGEPDEIARARLDDALARVPSAAPVSPSALPQHRSRRPLLVALALIVAASVGIAAYLMQSPEPTPPLYDRFFQLEDETGVVKDVFVVSAHAAFLTIDIDVGLRPSDCLSLVIKDPAGRAVVNESALCGMVQREVRYSPRADGQAGSWSIDARYERAGGWFRITADEERG